LSFFCVEKGGNKELSFKKKRQRGHNCCPSEREPDANEIEQIEAEQPRKMKKKYQLDTKGKRSQLGKSLRIFDLEGSLLYLSCYFDIFIVTFIKRNDIVKRRGETFSLFNFQF